MKVVAFGHRKRTGKDTACNLLIEHLRLKYPKLNAKKRGFADKLKEVSYDLFKWTGIKEPEYYEQFQDQKDKPLPTILNHKLMTMRDIWLEVGNRMREVYEPIWIQQILRTANCDILFIKDFRFPQEAIALKEINALLIKIVKPDVPDTDDEADRALKDYNGWDIVIHNDSDLKTFNSKLIELEERIMENVTITPAYSLRRY